jgi:methylthioribose-1-phosphate isomerase
MLEQRDLPACERYWELRTWEEVADGIRDMVVRGAPAIGISAAYGMTLASLSAPSDASDYRKQMQRAGQSLKGARPTAVNLAWAVDRVMSLVEEHAELPVFQRVEQVAALARDIHRSDVEACKQMGRLGASRVSDGATILTHCNAGALATGGYGTALGVVRAARDMGKTVRVLADETRPYLQGIRLTAWELWRDGIEVEVIADNMAAYFFQRGEVDLVVVGADRIARNGDVANKIGTYGLACLARWHECPFYVAAPFSTVDLGCGGGQQIPIEVRDPRELLEIGGKAYGPRGVGARYPAFDVTPHHLVSALFTERAVVEPVDEVGMVALDGKKR